MSATAETERSWAHAFKDNQLDKTDLRILALLQKQGRISKSALAAHINLSASACFERISRLEKRRYISSYHALVNMKSLMRIEVFMTQIALKSHSAADFRRFEAYVRNVPEIIECQALGGGIDYIIKVVAPTVDEYESIIQSMLDAEIGIERYFSYIVTKEVKNLPQYEISNFL